jgi:hypothetical protein
VPDEIGILKGENRHLAGCLGGKEGATLQFVSGKRGTKKVYTRARILRCTLVIKKVHSASAGQARAFVRNE